MSHGSDIAIFSVLGRFANWRLVPYVVEVHRRVKNGRVKRFTLGVRYDGSSGLLATCSSGGDCLPVPAVVAEYALALVKGLEALRGTKDDNVYLDVVFFHTINTAKPR